MKSLKKTFAVVLTFLMVLSCALVSSAADESDLTFLIYDGEAQLALCDREAQGVVDIPKTVVVGGVQYNVTSIGVKAFAECRGITQIIIPEGVRNIGSKAFLNCKALTEVYVPESLVTCQYDAFDGCEEMTVYCYTTNYQFFSVYGFNSNVSVEVIDKENINDATGGSGDASGDLENNMIVKIVKLFREFLDELLAKFGVSLGEDDFAFDIEELFPPDSILGGILGEIIPPEGEEDDDILGGILGAI